MRRGSGTSAGGAPVGPYLMNPDSRWRSYWASRVLYEARPHRLLDPRRGDDRGVRRGRPVGSYAVSDWRLQMNRALGLVRRGRIILAQSYLEPGDLRARGFVLGSYLLIKGSHTFIQPGHRPERPVVPRVRARARARTRTRAGLDRGAAARERALCAQVRERDRGGQPRGPGPSLPARRSGPAGPAGRRRRAERRRRHPWLGV